MYKKPSI